MIVLEAVLFAETVLPMTGMSRDSVGIWDAGGSTGDWLDGGIWGRILEIRDLAGEIP